MMRTVVNTPPVDEPVDLATAKSHAKVEVNSDDALFAVYIQAARELVEKETSRSLMETVWDGYLDCFPGPCDRDEGAIVLPHPPLISVDSIEYMPADGGAAVVLPTSEYIVDAVEEPGRVVLSPTGSWPATAAVPNAVKVTYTAGYGNDVSDVPAALRQAVLVLVADMYDNRSPVPTAFSQGQMRALCSPFVLGRIW